VRQALVAISHDPTARTALSDTLAILQDGDVDAGVQALISPETRKIVADAGERPFAARHEPLALEVEREAAGFAAWYELFPRSITDDPARHGTFDDVIAHLPRVRDMGFDVLYFPPIHPIGTKARKGRNNTLTPGPTDVGSPYAIGSAEGGHDALHPALGSFEDFRRLVAAARGHGLEIAIDFAIQCSPDHPWLKEHPDWFRHRPDGTIKYAENPPKKYEDIVNVDFYAKGAIPGLWQALRDVVLFWIGQGVTIFRVDNPHTKPLPFWQWMIADVRGRHPGAIFLSEAFTHPKMMYRLAKVGFSQSYSYFTWRNTRQELTEYLTELTTTEPAEFFRPNFFVNTPDINPVFLQSSGRAGFLIRAVLASTLSGLWGVYSGFEICEAAALPGREEYLDSEKYEIRVRDFSTPGNIVSEITRLNRIRKTNPALHSHLGVRFYNSSNGQVLVYGKALPSHEDMVFAIVSLDPHQPQETSFEIPLWEWNLPDNAALQAEDLMTGQRFTLHGKGQWLRLDPGVSPFALWRLTPEDGTLS
jgi:starch synthase (maltosyl-transferring)